MNNCAHQQAMSRPSILKVGLTLGLAVTFGLFTSNVSAQWLVQDVTTEAQTSATYGETVLQYAKQLEQYQNELNQYAQMLSSIQGLSTGMSLTPNHLQPIADSNSLIQAKCAGAASGGIVGSIMNSLTALLSQPLSQSQQQVCAQIVTTQVDKYNKTVDMLNKLNTYGGMFQGIEKTMSTISTLADSGRASDQAQHYSNALTTEMANWESDMRADDAIIKTLSDQQALLAHLALNGGGTSVLGDALPDDTFQSAIGGVE